MKQISSPRPVLSKRFVKRLLFLPFIFVAISYGMVQAGSSGSMMATPSRSLRPARINPSGWLESTHRKNSGRKVDVGNHIARKRPSTLQGAASCMPVPRTGEKSGKGRCGCSRLSVTGDLPGSSTRYDCGWKRRCLPMRSRGWVNTQQPHRSASHGCAYQSCGLQ